MIRFNRAPDRHAYLVDTDRSHTRNIFKLSSSLGVIIGICALSIWAFTPVSEQADYTLDYSVEFNPISVTPSFASAQTVQKVTQTAIAAAIPSAHAKISPPHKTRPNTLTPASNSDESFDSFSSIQVDESAEKHPETPANVSTSQTIATPKPTATSPSVQPGYVKKIKVKSGDTLTKIFGDADLPISQAIALSKEKEAKQLNRLSLGNKMRIYFDENNQWESLEYDVDKLNTLVVMPKNGSFDIRQHAKKVEYRDFATYGVIKSSLGAATEAAGMSANLAYSLMDIYKWEIDFARDLRVGDVFSVVYQKAYVDDEYIDDGPILAASFSTNGRKVEAIRFTDSNDVTAYFRPDGESLRRGFLRTPVKLARITSGFGNRLHPISKNWKRHMGVDYGAKGGTPILATADGIVQYAGKKGGYGKTIILRHGGIYTTLYAHLSKLAKGVRSGKPVEQGQVIGYVGHTGWATGDHLHYEFRVNGSHKDPLQVKLPKTLPLARKEVDSFSSKAGPLLVALANIKGNHLASNQSSKKKLGAF